MGRVGSVHGHEQCVIKAAIGHLWRVGPGRGGSYATPRLGVAAGLA